MQVKSTKKPIFIEKMLFLPVFKSRKVSTSPSFSLLENKKTMERWKFWSNWAQKHDNCEI